MKEKIDFYYTEKGEYAPKEGIPFVKRDNVAIIIKYHDQYLLISWNDTNYGFSLVTGGIDKNETKEDAVIRELKEETGYYDIKSITRIDCVNVSRFYVEHKNQNREAVYYPYLVELNSLEKNEIDELEQKEHSSVWMDKSEIEEIVMFDNHKRMLLKALSILTE